MGWKAWWQKWFAVAVPDGKARPQRTPDPPLPAAAKQAPSAPATDETAVAIRPVRNGPSTATFLHVDGVLNSATAADFEAKLGRFIEAGEVDLVVDFAGVPYVSSRGWGILISVLQTVRKQGGDIKIAGMCPGVLKLFYQTGLSSVFDLYEGQSTKRSLEEEL